MFVLHRCLLGFQLALFLFFLLGLLLQLSAPLLKRKIVFCHGGIVPQLRGDEQKRFKARRRRNLCAPPTAAGTLSGLVKLVDGGSRFLACPGFDLYWVRSPAMLADPPTTSRCHEIC